MATTPNYGWTTPDDTDLVKDGALAIRTLGDEIDSTVFGLGSGLKYLTKSTFTTQATVAIDNVFTSTYANYFIKANIIGSTTLNGLLRLRVGGVAATGANYNYQNFNAQGTTLTGARSTAQTSFNIQEIRSSTYNMFDISINAPQLTAETMIMASDLNDLTSPDIYQTWGAHQVSTAYDGFQIAASTGTITGTIWVYGFQNA